MKQRRISWSSVLSCETYLFHLQLVHRPAEVPPLLALGRECFPHFRRAPLKLLQLRLCIVEILSTHFCGIQATSSCASIRSDLSTGRIAHPRCFEAAAKLLEVLRVVDADSRPLLVPAGWDVGLQTSSRSMSAAHAHEKLEASRFLCIRSKKRLTLVRRRFHMTLPSGCQAFTTLSCCVAASSSLSDRARAFFSICSCRQALALSAEKHVPRQDTMSVRSAQTAAQCSWRSAPRLDSGSS